MALNLSIPLLLTRPSLCAPSLCLSAASKFTESPVQTPSPWPLTPRPLLKPMGCFSDAHKVFYMLITSYRRKFPSPSLRTARPYNSMRRHRPNARQEWTLRFGRIRMTVVL